MCLIVMSIRICIEWVSERARQQHFASTQRLSSAVDGLRVHLRPVLIVGYSLHGGAVGEGCSGWG